MTRQGTTWLVAIILLLTASSAALGAPKRVLVLHSFGDKFTPYVEFVSKFRADLTRQSSDPIDFYETSLATARFTDSKQDEAPFVDYLQALFAGRPLDLVVAVGGPAARFFQRHRQQIFSRTPVLFAAVEQRHLNADSLTANDAAVAVRIDLAAVVNNILTVLPQTKRIAIVAGASPLETFWVNEMRQAFQPFANRIAFVWLNELPFDQMLKRASVLPPDAAIFFGLLSVDAAGIPHEEDKALAALHGAANAPIFSYVDAHFGRGLVGGPMISLSDLSRQSATAAVRILRGEPPANVTTPVIGFAAPVFDWRELHRWRISETALPQGSIVQFREATIWDQYKWYVAAAAVVFLLQALFILMLLVNGRRLRRADIERRHAEEAAHELSGRLINAVEEERSRLARELHDDVTQRLALLAIDAGRAERNAGNPAGGSAMRTMREGLVRLSEDVHALSYRLHPSILEDLGLVEALRSECDRFSRNCSTPLEVHIAD